MFYEKSILHLQEKFRGTFRETVRWEISLHYCEKFDPQSQLIKLEILAK